ncbi:RIP metalloprotease RseP [Natroniella sulfidigena]|uniref:RIP metalloprotease RseP n=1 Tax=Natroniella sulfidigena TaxID=723921 RepID=UPI00200A2A05|nr:RIP metalloprotease RseP [Natroniella sulfidigena]MCK8816492.1 RIP metalloprotease RseP [Natroniella sulfidigena]
MTIISFIIVLGVLVFFHELGHFLVAKHVGVQVEEFALGMGPKLIGKQVGETLYSIRILPLGGFCKMTGEMPIDDDSDPEEVERYQEAVRKNKCLFQKSVWERIGVISMGSIMNFILAALLFALIFNIFGVPVDSSSSTVIGQVIPEQPAYQAGLRDGDKVVAVNEQQVETWEELSEFIHNNPGQQLSLEVERNGQLLELEVTPIKDEEQGKGIIGIIPILTREPVNILSALWLGIKQTGLYVVAIIVGLYQMITGQIAAEVSGPVRIAQMVGDAAQTGMLRVMNLAAIISVNLGIMNLLPIPALDGGRLVFLGYEIITGKPVDQEKEGMVHLIGFILLMVLFVIIMIQDLRTII